MLIGIVGLNGSGKDTAAKYICEKYDFKWISVSDIIRKECLKRGMSIDNRDNLNSLAEKLRAEEGPDVWVKKALINYSKNKKYVLSSFRHPSEIDRLKEKDGIIILIDAPIDVRFKRTVDRVLHNPKDHGSIVFEDFVAKEKRELSNIDPNKMQMGECIKKYDYKIDNSSNLDNLKLNIDKLMKEII
jgi:dephospho-CoA kinase